MIGLNKIKGGGKLLIANVILVLIFSLVYFIMGHENFNGLDENSGFMDYFYFSFTTMSAVGYGDISPRSTGAKILVMLHQTIILLELTTSLVGLISEGSKVATAAAVAAQQVA